MAKTAAKWRYQDLNATCPSRRSICSCEYGESSESARRIVRLRIALTQGPARGALAYVQPVMAPREAELTVAAYFAITPGPKGEGGRS